MSVDNNRKQARTPLSPEEIKYILTFRKLRDLKQIDKLKKTKAYKFLNIFNIICVCVYSEMIFCMFGPAVYKPYSCKDAYVSEFAGMKNSKRVVRFMVVKGANDQLYKINVNETIQTPKANSTYYLGTDYLLGKEIKLMVSTSTSEFMLWKITPLIFLGIFITLITALVYFYNMNMVSYSLIAISVLNGLNLFYFIVV